MAITEKLLTGAAVASCIEDLAALRLDIFREYPYLYAGCREDERGYLRLYAEVAEAFVIVVTDNGTLAGAATGIPLCAEQKELVEPFTGSAYPLDEIYYVGELLFTPAYRNRGLGQQLLQQVAQQVHSFGKYRYLTCATVVRPADHPLRPAGYRPIDRFLAHTGFSRLSGVTTSLEWPETDGARREHAMQFWLRELHAWQLWRQDDNGNRFLVGEFASSTLAESRMAELMRSHHKQSYWVGKRTSC